MIVLLTYAAPHRKTEDVLLRLLAAGIKPAVLAMPWIDRKPRTYLYPHRPGEPPWPAAPTTTTQKLCEAFGLEYEVAKPEDLFSAARCMDADLLVVGGAGLLPSDLVLSFKVLNVHPGLLPQCRGLDILKWSIIECLRVGVTAHLVDDRADLGWRISDAVVPVYHNDTFHAFAHRQYEMELGLIVPAIRAALDVPREVFQRIEPAESTSRMRMPRKVECGLLPAFERYKLVYA